MRVSLDWLKDYVDIKEGLTIKNIADVITKAGLEVEEIKEIKKNDLIDFVLTLSITPNRADALSHLGIARELAAALDLNLKSPMISPTELAGPTHDKVSVEIENISDTPRYACRVIEGVKVENSPEWLKERLLAIGQKPINNVVDITNFVMFSRGQPIHAFDYDKLTKENGRAKIYVSKIASDQNFIALDGQELKLTSEDLVISDQNGAVALAGIIGGRDSAVNESTTSILLESAYFCPHLVRSTSRRLQTITESGYRFERGVDPNGVLDGLNYAARLIAEIAQGRVCREPLDAYRKRIDPLEIKMRPERAREILGLNRESFDEEFLRRKFLALGIEAIAKNGDAIYFRIPTSRSDITREIDLIEEAGRMIGYENISSNKASFFVGKGELCNKINDEIIEKISSHLTHRGFSETINYSFVNKDFLSLFLSPKEISNIIELINPMSTRQGAMRTTLIPGLINSLIHNDRSSLKDIRIFENGSVFLGINKEGMVAKPDLLTPNNLYADSYCDESVRVSGLIAGENFFFIKAIVEESLWALGLSALLHDENYQILPGAHAPYLHPGVAATIYSLDQGKTSFALGIFGQIHPSIQKQIDIATDIFIFELDIAKIATVYHPLKKYIPFSRMPAIERDVAFLVDESVPVEGLINVASSVKNFQKILADVQAFDIYRGQNLPIGKKSIAISLKFQDKNRTLTDEEADGFVKEFVAKANKKTGAILR